jgi:hypothetical protein
MKHFPHFELLTAAINHNRLPHAREREEAEATDFVVPCGGTVEQAFAVMTKAWPRSCFTP